MMMMPNRTASAELLCLRLLDWRVDSICGVCSEWAQFLRYYRDLWPPTLSYRAHAAAER